LWRASGLRAVIDESPVESGCAANAAEGPATTDGGIRASIALIARVAWREIRGAPWICRPLREIGFVLPRLGRRGSMQQYNIYMLNKVKATLLRF
jgi:hypothetical protein